MLGTSDKMIWKVLQDVLDKKKEKYVIPSPSDVVFSALDEQTMHFVVETYKRAIFSDEYKKADARFRESLVVHTIIESIKARGGKCLKACPWKQGIYYEVNDCYSIAKIKKALDQSKN